MRRTQGFYKAYISVEYTNEAGVVHHLADFQIATSRNIQDCEQARDKFNEQGETVLPKPVQDYLKAMRNSLYDLTLDCTVMG